ncbi:hypothetical protein AVW11_03855 [Streptomyces amritsarensis]|uniref:Helix-turn-helix domain-containing protein n=2 Tax=Streptomyces amritsarensis TaxID=681158 RepID=A0ABX3GC91_9ACTN|nr:hypothetical protein AVW11_03855 [Streptomyces amritsarensis]
MPRPCRIDGCPDAAARHKTACHRHRTRIRRYGDPHFTTWTVADETDIQIAVARRELPPGMTRLERRLVGEQLTRRGASATEIARIAGVTPRTVVRWRTTERKAA